jgi:pimeloyl-ACP methyl ester carboxylesterase
LTLPIFTAMAAPHAYRALGRPLQDIPGGEVTPHVVWAHGWGQDHHAFLALAGSLARAAHHTLVDFPGFGESPRPAADWGTADYADAMAEWLAGLPRGRRIWVGHSFGCRVGMRLAARHPELIDAMVLVAGAGLRRRRSLVERLRIFLRVRAFKALKFVERLGIDVDARKAKYGSADYRSAGAMRPIFVKVATEDQTEVARAIRCPVSLIYGERDGETPPEMGERLSRLIPRSTLKIIPGLDHHTILTDGGPQVVHAVSQLLES